MMSLVRFKRIIATLSWVDKVVERLGSDFTCAYIKCPLQKYYLTSETIDMFSVVTSQRINLVLILFTLSSLRVCRADQNI